jgi:hypothetical protein
MGVITADAAKNAHPPSYPDSIGLPDAVANSMKHNEQNM